MLNYEEIKKDPQRIKKIKPFINKYYWEGIDFPSMVLFWSKKLSALLRGIPSKHYGDFYCLNCLHSFNTKNKFDSHKKVCKNKDFCNVIMLFQDTKILEFNQYQKSDKAPFIIYRDLECIIEKIDGCKNNLNIRLQQK